MRLSAIGSNRGIYLPLLFSLVLLLAGARPAATPATKPSNLGLILLSVALLIGVPVAYRLWRETHADETTERGTDLLSDFEQAYAAGQMNEAEFRRIRALVIGEKMGVGGKLSTKPRDIPRQTEDPPPPAPPETPDRPSDPS